jgi:hypothetical protein
MDAGPSPEREATRLGHTRQRLRKEGLCGQGESARDALLTRGLKSPGEH